MQMVGFCGQNFIALTAAPTRCNRFFMSKISTAADVMAKWPSDAAFARAIGVKPSHGAVMKIRGRIPPAYWRKIVVAARDSGVKGVTLESLAKMAEAQ